MAEDATRDQPISFGPFRLFPRARLLEKDGAPLRIGGRALDILIFLAGHPGEVVDKRKLMKEVWANVNVDEGSLRFHVAGLRKVLGDGAGDNYVKNVPGRGYCFAAHPAPFQPSAAPLGGNASRSRPLPPRMAKLFGRTEATEKISADISQYRIVTIVGPGGIGKTSVAVDVAHRHLEAFRDQSFFVDFGAVTDMRLVPGAIASALGLTVNSQDPVPSLLTFLRGRSTLLILDSCEHVLDVLAPLVEQIAREAPESHILATSREALRIESERVFRLLPLNCPPQNTPFKSTDILAYPATQLFMERIAESLGNSELSEEESPMVAEICQRLDGIPLAIELAAGRVNAYGIAGTASLLDGHMSLLWRGRRTAIPRHQTLSATLGWSYDLLPAIESATLRRLSMFSGPFTLEAAIAMASSGEVSKSEAVEAIASLVSKSLISMPSERPLRYRLLDTTRAFAREKLAERGEADQAARAHTQYFCDFLKEISTGVPSDGRFLPHADQAPNVRSALDWSFSDHGDRTIGVDLAAAAAEFFFELSFVTECYHWTNAAIAAMQESERGTRLEIDLQGALAVSAMFSKGNTPEVEAAIGRGVELSLALGDKRRQLKLLVCLHLFHNRYGDMHASLEVAKECLRLASEIGDGTGIEAAHRMLGVSHALRGERVAAERHFQLGFAQGAGKDVINDLIGETQRLGALVACSRTLWLRGHPAQAIELANEVVLAGGANANPANTCMSFAYATQVFLWSGEYETARRVINQLIELSNKYSLASFYSTGLGLMGQLEIALGNHRTGAPQIETALSAMRAEPNTTLGAPLRTSLAEALAAIGDFDRAMVALTEAKILAEETGGQFHLPETLRLIGAVLMAKPDGDKSEAEQFLLRSLELSRLQESPGWELRCAITFARMQIERGQREEARNVLVEICKQFSDDCRTSDLLEARTLIDSLKPNLRQKPSTADCRRPKEK